MDLLSLFFGLLVGAIAVYIYLDRQLKVLNTEKIHLEVSLDEK
ncbi:MAG: DNA recombination protein RmuC, partial [Candidatus Thioglobus sp.]|nr:DNA recombination protein RmuC [Candidatus Thioglobus sp.]